MRSGMSWVKALLLVAAVAAVPACSSNKNLYPPQITAVSPTTVAGVIPNIIVQFDRPMDPAFVGDVNYYAVFEDPSTISIAFSVEYLSVLNEVRIIPTALLNSGKTYHVYIAGAVASAAGVPMGNTIHFDFVTSAQTAATATSFISWSGATPSAGAAGEIVLTWADATGTTVGNGTPGPIIANYDIYMSTTDQGEDLMLPPSVTPSPTMSPKTITGLTTGTTYYFKVQPRDSTGCVFRDLLQISFTAP